MAQARAADKMQAWEIGSRAFQSVAAQATSVTTGSSANTS
jgi:hypothetical protein